MIELVGISKLMLKKCQKLPQHVEHKLLLFVYECGGRRLHNYQSSLSWRAKQSSSNNCKGDEPYRVVGDLAR